LTQIKKDIESLKLEAERAQRMGDYAKVSEIQYGKLREKEDELQKLELAMQNQQNELVKEEVTAENISEVVAKWTGIPVTKLLQSEREKLLHLEDELHKRVVGQEEAIQSVADAIRRNRAGLNDEKKPIGSFLFLGTTGVGKTETALALADTFYGGEQNVITINMSEFQEAHTVSTLKGAPPGYVGYGEGGILTEAVRRRPYSVVLLDEVEKAHPDVHEIFFQVFDKGWMEDGEGRYIDFKNTIIILTTNVGTDLIMDMCEDPDLLPSPEGLLKALRPSLLKVFPAALLGRMQVIPYYPLSTDMLKKIVELQLGNIVKRIKANHNIELTYQPAVLNLIVSRCTEIESGGRMIDAILTNTVLPQISRELLSRATEDKQIFKIKIGVKNNDFTYSYK